MAPSHVGVCLSWRIFAGVDNDERFLIAKSEFWSGVGLVLVWKLGLGCTEEELSFRQSTSHLQQLRPTFDIPQAQVLHVPGPNYMARKNKLDSRPSKAPSVFQQTFSLTAKLPSARRDSIFLRNYFLIIVALESSKYWNLGGDIIEYKVSSCQNQ